MIKLEYQPKPAILTDEFVAAQTQEFINSSKSVWDIKELKETLLSMSQGKCCYCECSVIEGGSYMEVEHWLPKNHYPDLVLLWENLFPSCKRCNGTKSEHDTGKEPILHPVNDIPSDHLYIKNYRLEGKTPIGDLTKKILNLNHIDRLGVPRFRVCEQLKETLNDLYYNVEELNQGVNKQKRRLQDRLEKVMCLCLKTEYYSAFKATILLNENSYQTIKDIFNQHELWTTQFQELEDQIRACALELG